MKNTISPRLLALAAIIIAAGVYRLIVTTGAHPVLAYLSPLGAMALFSGCYFRSPWKAYLTPLLTLWLTDVVLNRFVYFHAWVLFYDGFIWVYASFALMVFLGRCIRHVTVGRVVIAAVGAALLHWIVADLGIWLSGGCVPTEGPYTPTLNTLIITLKLAIPSLANMLTSNLVFGFVLFGAFELLQRQFPLLRLQNA